MTDSSNPSSISNSFIKLLSDYLGLNPSHAPQPTTQGNIQQEIGYFYPNLSATDIDSLASDSGIVSELFHQLSDLPFNSPSQLTGWTNYFQVHSDSIAPGPSIIVPQADAFEAVPSFSHVIKRNTSDEPSDQDDDIGCGAQSTHKRIRNKRTTRIFAIDEEQFNPPTEVDEDQLAEEVMAHMKKWQEMGFPYERMEQLFRLLKPEVSRLIITPDYRIILTDYQDREVILSTLPKALFFLYLRHPEGIEFKRLIEHRAELREIYLNISRSTNIEKLNKSIKSLTDTISSNSANEKSSRIKQAFYSLIAPNLAEPYIISKDPDGIQRIALDRSMIIDQARIIS